MRSKEMPWQVSFVLQGFLHNLKAKSGYFVTLTLSGNEEERSRFFALLRMT